jgi:Zn-dependent metalloprotease
LQRWLTRRAPLAALVAYAATQTPGAALAVGPAAPSRAAGPVIPDRLLDVRLGLRDRAAAATVADPAVPRAGTAARSVRSADRVAGARRDLVDGLGAQASLSVDPLTGTVRELQRLNGALTGPSGQAPAAIARDYATAHATAIGLDAADAAALRVDGQVRGPDGLSVVHLGQAVDGVPTFDNGLRVGIDRAGRVLTVGGAPRSDLPSSLPAPPLDAAAALARLMDDVGVHHDVTVTATAADARRTTSFSNGDTARLVLFGARGVHLAWHLTYAASSVAVYDAVVDAATGEVLYRANLVKFAGPAQVFRNYPGDPAAPQAVPLLPNRTVESYLTPGATKMSGPNVGAYADLNDDNIDNGGTGPTGEDTAPPNTSYAFTAASGSHCDSQHLCAWDHATATSWQANKDQNVVQTFWYANHFHDHLANGAIGFNSASGSFDSNDPQHKDPLELNALDGANTSGGGPDAAHLDNSNMYTPPDKQSPRMQMYLFAYQPSAGKPFRDVNGGDDAVVVYHEYTHGLSSRLITTSDGSGALNAPQSGAMGEGWSDWYAEDLLVREGLVTDSAADGEVELGRYLDAAPHALRHEPLDCGVGSTVPACAGTAATGPGGFTFGDYGKIAGRPEVHADGEIWSQTLWQLRQRLVAQFGATVGSDTAEKIITDAMRVAVPEPSFLDMRNAMVAATTNDYGSPGVVLDIVWEVFRSRGMGFYAGTTSSSDAAPVEDFSPPPPAGGPQGAIAGTVTSANSGLPIAGARAAVGGLSTKPTFWPDLQATADSAGRYAIGAVPQGTYPKVRFGAGGYDTLVQPVTVTGGQPAAADAGLRRNWAAAAGGGRVTDANDHGGDPFGCGAGALIDQSQGTGWSAVNHLHDAVPQMPTATIRLPQAITVEELGMDPGHTCGDNSTAATKGYRLETSPDGTAWTVAAEGQFSAADAGRLNLIRPTAGTAGVQFVRLTLKSPQREAAGDDGANYIDFSELEVYGNPPNVLPSGTLTASATSVPPGTTVTFDASSFTDPDSAITGYDWDFDGDGVVDRTTAGPSTDFTYMSAGTPTATVAVKDFRGGAGIGAVAMSVAARKAPKAKPSLLLPSTGTRGRVRFKVTCRDPCRLTATLTVDRATRRKRHLLSTIVGKLAPRTVSGTRTLSVTLTRSARTALRRRHVRRVHVTLRAGATVAGGGPNATATRRIRLQP